MILKTGTRWEGWSFIDHIKNIYVAKIEGKVDGNLLNKLNITFDNNEEAELFYPIETEIYLMSSETGKTIERL